MKVEQNTRLRRRTTAKSSAGDHAPAEKAYQQLAHEIVGSLPDNAKRFVARAPGRLDIMGAIAECSSSLVLNMPIQDDVCLAMQVRSDGVVSINRHNAAASDSDRTFQCRLHDLGITTGRPVSAAQGLKLLSQPNDQVARCILAVLIEADRKGWLAGSSGGLSIVAGVPVERSPEAGAWAALAAAALVCLTKIGNIQPDQAEAVALCQRVANDWLCEPAGAADAACALLGEPNTVAQLRGRPFELMGAIQLPDDLVIVGIDCGSIHPDVGEKIKRARTAALMGRLLIGRIIQHENGGGQRWDGHLARLSVTDYVERFRDRIPTKLSGREFLDRFGDTGDPHSCIDPGDTYKIRSRTEHHIYEHARACQFVECLSRSIRKGNYDLLAEAGELMYASHWSYGQRCGLGCAKADVLVNLLRGPGLKADIYGAKMSGRGCGGIVTILARRTDRAEATIESALQAYKGQTESPARLLRGSSAGALVAGAQVL